MKSEQPIRLSVAQESLLSRVAKEGSTSIAPYYPPLKKLLALGFLQLRHQGSYSEIYEVTKAGKAWLEAHSEKRP